MGGPKEVFFSALRSCRASELKHVYRVRTTQLRGVHVLSTGISTVLRRSFSSVGASSPRTSEADQLRDRSVSVVQESPPLTALFSADDGPAWPDILLCEDFLPSLYSALRQTFRPQVSFKEEPGNVFEISWRIPAASVTGVGGEAGNGRSGNAPADFEVGLGAGEDLRVVGRAIGNSPSQAKERATRKLVRKLAFAALTPERQRFVWKQVLNTARQQLRVRVESVQEFRGPSSASPPVLLPAFGSGEQHQQQVDSAPHDGAAPRPYVFRLIWSWTDEIGEIGSTGTTNTVEETSTASSSTARVLPPLVAEGHGPTPELAEFAAYCKAAELAQDVRCVVHDALRDAKKREDAEAARERLRVAEQSTWTRLPDEDVRSLAEMHDELICALNAACANGNRPTRQTPGIVKTESVLPYKNGFLHTLEWSVKRGRGAASQVESVRGLGRTRAAARAKACEQMLKIFGCIDEAITEDARCAAADIRRMCRNGQLGPALRRAQELASFHKVYEGGALKTLERGAAAQTLFLLDLWRLAAAEGRAVEVLREVVVRGQKGKPLLDVSIWERLVDETSFGDVRAIVAGHAGAGHERGRRRGTPSSFLELLQDVELTPRPFRSDAARDYFRKFRFLCAAERRATLVQGLRQLAWCSSGDHEDSRSSETTPDEAMKIATPKQDLPEEPPLPGTTAAQLQMQVIDSVLPFLSLSPLEGDALTQTEIRVEDVLVLEKKYLLRVVRREEKRLYGQVIGEADEALFELLSAIPDDEVANSVHGQQQGRVGENGEEALPRVSVSLLESEVTANRQVNALRSACFSSSLSGGAGGSGVGLSYDPAFISELLAVKQEDDHDHARANSSTKKPSELLPSVQRIFGPPGTGKTYSACSIVSQWREDEDGLSTSDIFSEDISRRKKRVLCVADSNVAADNFYRHLRKLGVGCLRFRNVNIPPLSSAGKEDARQAQTGGGGWGGVDLRRDESLLKKWKELKKPKQRQNMWREALLKTSVAVTTCVGAGHPVFAGIEYPRVIVDEATQSTEPSTLVALGRNCSELVLIGDDKQLPPTVLVGGGGAERRVDFETSSSDGAGEVEEAPLGKIGQKLKRTMFERLAGSVATEIFLDTQRRMHPDLLAFPNAEFYANRIRTAVDLMIKADYTLQKQSTEDPRPKESSEFDQQKVTNGGSYPHPLPLPSTLKHRISFVDTSRSGAEEQTPSQSQSKRNPVEAEQVAAFVRRLAAVEPELQIVVLTPYAAQQGLLKEALAGADKKIRVATIDGFQGSEADVVVLSTVRTERLGFLNDAKRMNVALTRGKRAVVVFGSRRVLFADVGGHWARWMERYGGNEAIIGGD